MKTGAIVLASFLCFVSVLASADSISSIPITGEIQQGFAIANGDFNLSGPGLSLFQGTPDGPASIGSCTVGAVCQFNFSIGNTAGFCTYCSALSGGSLGSKTAEYLDPNLTLTGSAFYSGSSSLNVPLTITGTIIGYELLNCTGGVGCTLGPKEFAIQIVAHGTGQLSFQPEGNFSLIIGVLSSVPGTATVIPEPTSLVLTATGLVGLWIRRKTRAV